MPERLVTDYNAIYFGRGDRGRPYGVPPRPPRRYVEYDGNWSVAAIIRVLLDPAPLFEELRIGADLSTASAFAVVHGALLAALWYLADSAGLMMTDQARAAASVVASAAIWAAAGGIIALVLSHVMASLLHVPVWAGQGRGGYRATYLALVYSSVPATLLLMGGWIVGRFFPELAILGTLLGIAGVAWTAVLCATGLVWLHDLRGLGSVLAVMAPLMLLALLALSTHAMTLDAQASPSRPLQRVKIALHRFVPASVSKAMTDLTGGSRNDDGPQHRPRMPR